MSKPDIEHATADEIHALAENRLLTHADCKVLADALLVVNKLKCLRIY